ASCGAITAPCASFQQAHDNVAVGGEVGVLTPGDYGFAGGTPRLAIGKSISITNDGVGEATVTDPDGQAIFIGAGNGDVVSVRGLVIDGRGLGQNGITFQTGLALHIQNCVIRNFSQGGLVY